MSSGKGTLAILHPVFSRKRGAWFEAEIFSTLLRSPFVLRSFEFALADGAVDCELEYPISQSFSERLRSAIISPPDRRSSIFLVDAKGTVNIIAGQQLYFTTKAQSRRVAVFIAICAADPTFVEVFPNLQQDADFLEIDVQDDEKKEKCAVKLRKACKLSPRTYGRLDPSGCPFRMPRHMLPEAIFRLRCCALGLGDYENPWTGVIVAQGWKPATTKRRSWLLPAEESAHFTAYEQVAEIQRLISVTPSLGFAFLWLQPAIGDFKLILNDRPYIIQHKIDSRLGYRGANTKLEKVAIARDQPDGRTYYYFNTFDRMDFLFYYFEFRSSVIHREIFFIPEKVFPDEFYTTTNIEASFEIAEFQEFRIEMNDSGAWLDKIKHIMLLHYEPRAPPRPMRNVHDIGAEQDLRSNDEQDLYSDDEQDWMDQENIRDISMAVAEIRSSEKTGSLGKTTGQDPVAGRSAYAEVLRCEHRRFYDKIMTQCALHKRGLLVVLARDNPLGDFGYCTYRWSKEEQADFFKLGHPPQVLHTLPQHTPIIPILYFARSREAWYQGPNITSAEFHCLDSHKQPRLVIWSVAGPDCMNTSLSPAIIPSEDLQPTSRQLKLFEKNLLLDTTREFSTNTPTALSLLQTSRFMAEYSFGNGPAAYLKDDWIEYWALLEAFTDTSIVQHPHGYWRDPSEYRLSLKELLQYSIGA